MSRHNMRKALNKLAPAVAPARNSGKHAALAMAHGGTAHHYADYLPYTPPRFDGKPFVCLGCDQTLPKRVSPWLTGRCECTQPLPESTDEAMQRRAHWLLKREFGPSEQPVLDRYHVNDAMSYGVHTGKAMHLMGEFEASTYNIDYAKLEREMATKMLTNMMGDIVHDETHTTADRLVQRHRKGGAGGA